MKRLALLFVVVAISIGLLQLRPGHVRRGECDAEAPALKPAVV